MMTANPKHGKNRLFDRLFNDAGRACGVDTRGSGTQVTVRQGWRARERIRQDLPPPPGARVAAGLSPGAAVAVWITAPFASRRKALRVAPALLDIELPFPIEDCVWTVSDDRPAPGGRDLFAVAARESDIRKRMDALASIGIDPHVLDHDGLALWSHALRVAPVLPNEQFRVVCYLHPQGAILAIGPSDRLMGVYTIARADRAHMERLLVARFGADWRKRPDPDGTILFFICGPDAAGAAAALQRDLDPPPSMRWVVADRPESFLADALAERAVLVNGPLACNFRRGHLAHADDVARARRSMQSALLALVLAGILAGGVGVVARVATQQRLDRLNRRFRVEATRLAGYPVLSRGRDAVNEVERAVGEHLEQRAVFKRQREPSLLEPLQRVVVSAAAVDATIERLSLALDGHTVVTLHLPHANALAGLLDRLSDAGLRPTTPPEPRNVPAANGVSVVLTLARENP